MKRLIMDLDNTISINKTGNYSEAMPIVEVIEKMRKYKEIRYILREKTLNILKMFCDMKWAMS